MFTDSDGRTHGLVAAVAVALSMAIPAAAVAQTSGQSGLDDPPAGVSTVAPTPESGAPGASDGAAPPAMNPHALLGELNGGPGGSPTAQRGNPRPGTSTSIPTTNPAPIAPLPQRGAEGNMDAVEDTGIAGQCDPVVSLGCPTISEYVPEVEAEVAEHVVAPAATTEPAAEPMAAPATDGAAAPAAPAN